jgi:predicted RNase H-like HicB family nuclease
MKLVYPVVISRGSEHLLASIPDCGIDTQGHDITDAIYMARDALSLWCVCEQDAGRELPVPSALGSVAHGPDEIVTLVDADIGAYRKRLARTEQSKRARARATVPVEAGT